MSRKEISGGEKIVLDGLLLEISSNAGLQIKTFSAETVYPLKGLLTVKYSNPVYSRLVSEGPIKFDLKSLIEVLGTLLRLEIFHVIWLYFVHRSPNCFKLICQSFII